MVKIKFVGVTITILVMVISQAKGYVVHASDVGCGDKYNHVQFMFTM
jgi:hypothetical protein